MPAYTLFVHYMPEYNLILKFIFYDKASENITSKQARTQPYRFPNSNKVQSPHQVESYRKEIYTYLFINSSRTKLMMCNKWHYQYNLLSCVLLLLLLLLFYLFIYLFLMNLFLSFLCLIFAWFLTYTFYSQKAKSLKRATEKWPKLLFTIEHSNQMKAVWNVKSIVHSIRNLVWCAFYLHKLTSFITMLCFCKALEDITSNNTAIKKMRENSVQSSIIIKDIRPKSGFYSKQSFKQPILWRLSTPVTLLLIFLWKVIFYSFILNQKINNLN